MAQPRLALGALALLLLAACGDDHGGTGGDAGRGDAGEDLDAQGDGPGDGDGGIDAPVDAGIDATPVMSINAVFPPAASRLVTTTLQVTGNLLAPGATLRLSNCDTATVYDLSPTVVVAGNGLSLTAVLAAEPAREQGLYTVTVTNPDGQTDALRCAFRVLGELPPVVTDVIPATAFRGVPGDGINSDTTVSIVGSGFTSTPTVRWVRTDGSASFGALFVGFVSPTQLTAVVPSETLAMPAGSYHVFVSNPDQLTGQWLVDAMTPPTPGVFTVTATPPPDILDVTPARIENGACTSTPLTITGTAFAPMARVWYLAPPGTTCAGSTTDPNGATLCPLVVDQVNAAGTSITAHFGACPALGPYPLVVVNPDRQSDYFYSIEITPSSDGHLNTGSFTATGAALLTPRWRHAAAFGFDVFANSHVYVAGGQDASGAVLASVETSQLDIFGTPGPFRRLEQYFSPANPRGLNALMVPRQGGTLVRLGRTLFSLGGATAATDVAAAVPASNEVEVARILSFDEMPGIRRPTVVAGNGLPNGTWYYRVSAIGPWGESLPSREVEVVGGGAIDVCWNPPPIAGTTGYAVYRSLAADGRAGTAAALRFAVPGPCLHDDGTGLLAPAPASLRGTVTAGGALSARTHHYRVSATVPLGGGMTFETYASYASITTLTPADLANGRATVTLAWDPIVGATYSVFKLDPASGRYRLLAGAGALANPALVDDGLAFDAVDRGPRTELVPLPPGSLSRWDANLAPPMGSAREGLDGVAIDMDPATSGGLIGRVLVAGGRTSNASGAGAYLRTAESLGVRADGTFEPAWSAETALFTFPRAYYALLTTQGRNDTPFPPPPPPPPCPDADGDGAIDCACAPPGTPPGQLDCNDADPTVHPGAMEVCGDNRDQDCDMGCTGSDVPCTCTIDVDMDLHVSRAACQGDDCCDNGAEVGVLGCTPAHAPGIHPGAVEICADGIDQNCDGVDPPCTCTTDADGDGHITIRCGGDDCCDVGTDISLGCTDVTDTGIHPGAFDVCGNAVDENCDGVDNICGPPVDQGAAPYQPAASEVALPPTTPRPIANVIGNEPIYLVAVAGDDQLDLTANQGRQDFEACLVDPITGRLSGTSWTVQTNNDVQRSFAGDALLYFSYLYPFYGVSRETVSTTPSTRQLINSAIGRHPLANLTMVAGGQVIGTRQSASTTFVTRRAYYPLLRLLSYVYVIGGWSDAVNGPVGSVERHQQ